MGEDVHLTAAKDRNGRFSGYYKCSHCQAEFRPNPKVIREIAASFAAHVKCSHPAPESENAMLPDMSRRQRKAVEKTERLRKYFGEDSPRINEWTPSDEGLDFATMSDEDVARYLEHSTVG